MCVYSDLFLRIFQTFLLLVYDNRKENIVTFLPYEGLDRFLELTSENIKKYVQRRLENYYHFIPPTSEELNNEARREEIEKEIEKEIEEEIEEGMECYG